MGILKNAVLIVGTVAATSSYCETASEQMAQLQNYVQQVNMEYSRWASYYTNAYNEGANICQQAQYYGNPYYYQQGSNEMNWANQSKYQLDSWYAQQTQIVNNYYQQIVFATNGTNAPKIQTNNGQMPQQISKKPLGTNANKQIKDIKIPSNPEGEFNEYESEDVGDE